MEDHELPATHGLATHVSVVLFHTKAGVLQAQLDWPVSVLVVLYADDVPHARQLASLASEKVCAPQAAHVVSAVGVHIG